MVGSVEVTFNGEDEEIYIFKRETWCFLNYKLHEKQREWEPTSEEAELN